MNSEMSSVHIAVEPPSVVVQLLATDPTLVAAGIVEWRRTLAGGSTWVWRTPLGTEIHVATTGHAPECPDVPIAVVAGPIPHDGRLDHGLDPGRTDELDDDTLYQWLGSEIAGNWPFESTTDIHHGATA